MRRDSSAQGGYREASFKNYLNGGKVKGEIKTTVHRSWVVQIVPGMFRMWKDHSE